MQKHISYILVSVIIAFMLVMIAVINNMQTVGLNVKAMITVVCVIFGAWFVNRLYFIAYDRGYHDAEEEILDEVYDESERMVKELYRDDGFFDETYEEGKDERT